MYNLHVFVQFLFCALNFMLSACRPVFAEVALTAYKVEQARPTEQKVSNIVPLVGTTVVFMCYPWTAVESILLCSGL